MKNRNFILLVAARTFARRLRPLMLAFALGLSACSSLSGLSPLPTEAALPTETQSSIQTATPIPSLTPSAVPSTPTLTPTTAPAFDITNRTGPSITDKTAYIQWMQANSTEPKDYLDAKWHRAQVILEYQVATEPRILAAFLITPREYFFDAADATQAYATGVASIGYGQTIPGPYLVVHMVQAIDPQPDQKVLEIGTGSGYTSALLSELSNYVYTMEIVPQLAQKDDELYTSLLKTYPEYANIRRVNADGYYGWPQYAPFDRIIVTAGIDHVPPDLLAQLAPDGIMVIPVGPPAGQTVLKITKQVQPDGSITFVREDIYNGMTIRFVPFTGGP